MKRNLLLFFAVLLLMVAGFQTAQAHKMIVRSTDNQLVEYDISQAAGVAPAEGEQAEKLLIFSYDVEGVRYSLFKKIFEDDQQPNADGALYYRSEMTLDLTKDGVTTSYFVDNDLYLTKEIGSGQTPCIAIDLTSRTTYIFTNSKTKSRNYAMNGYAYISPLDKIEFQKETVFTSANWGWWPYFTYEDETLFVQHFSFGGYYAMTSTRYGNGEWNTDYVASIYPDDFAALWKEHTSLLVIVDDVDTGEHEYVDLGLPSGTLWATCNVGASKPEEYGDYFAWGETIGYNGGKTYFDWDTYFDSQFEKYNNNGGQTELLPEDDAATANWGAPWHMPTIRQIEELLDNCSQKWTTRNDVNGILVTSNLNGGQIFLPAAGRRLDGELQKPGSYGFYWSSSLLPDFDSSACMLYFYSDFCSWGYHSRFSGRSVRPVRVQGAPNPTLVTSITLSETSLSLYVNDTKTLTATMLPEDADNKKVTWSSSNSSIATVDQSGKVTAVAAGSCTITCSATDGSGVKAECQVTVIEEGTGERVLNILLADGDVVAIRLAEEPYTIYQDGNLVITTNDYSISYPLEMVKRFTYVYTNDVIDAVKTIEADFSNDGETITFSRLKPHTKIALYNISGQLLKLYDNADCSEIVVSVSHFPTGVYIVKVNGGTYKIMKR